MTQYSRRPSGFCRREQFTAGAKADSHPAEDGAGQPLQRMAAKGAGGRSGDNHRRAGDIYEHPAVQETYFSSSATKLLPCRSTLSLRVSARRFAICSITNNRTDRDGGYRMMKRSQPVFPPWSWIPALAESTDWNYDANYAILRGYDGAGGDVVVPAEIDGYTVDVIGVSCVQGRYDHLSDAARDGAGASAATPSPRAKIWPALRCPRALWSSTA